MTFDPLHQKSTGNQFNIACSFMNTSSKFEGRNAIQALWPLTFSLIHPNINSLSFHDHTYVICELLSHLSSHRSNELFSYIFKHFYDHALKACNLWPMTSATWNLISPSLQANTYFMQVWFELLNTFQVITETRYFLAFLWPCDTWPRPPKIYSVHLCMLTHTWSEFG